ncbi:Pr6Pr family membrane protein [Demequina aurantiaca]|uniref:Pr6Pr family membrane protein n=1 Tax=Demequina aurantiaca TaxID=676200 RepID=UPI000780D22E|nr:Pr6Pr family membrane protein [Demequina aurantiaca]
MVRTFRVLAALGIMAAVVASALPSMTDGTFKFFNTYGFFTNQTNAIAAAALIVAAIYTRSPRPDWVELLRASAAVYLTVVTIVYWLLLAPFHDAAVPWANTVLHLASGIIVVADWLIAGPRRPLPLGKMWIVLIYPALWLGVILARGITDGWVPYPFLNPNNGYAYIATICLVVVSVGALFSAVYFRAPRWRPDPTHATTSPAST